MLRRQVRIGRQCKVCSVHRTDLHYAIAVDCIAPSHDSHAKHMLQPLCEHGSNSNVVTAVIHCYRLSPPADVTNRLHGNNSRWKVQGPEDTRLFNDLSSQATGKPLHSHGLGLHRYPPFHGKRSKPVLVTRINLTMPFSMPAATKTLVVLPSRACLP